MGWFDDSDSDDDTKVKQKRLSLLQVVEERGKNDANAVEGNSHQNDGDENDDGNDNGNGDGDDDDEVDPLDAFMTNLGKTAQDESNSKPRPKRERMDMDNEDEATSHWKESTASAADKNSSSLEQEQAREEMDSMFHKAGSTSTNVDIKLEAVNHRHVRYDDFEKRLWQRNTSPQGHAWRKQNQITCHPPIDPIYSLHELKGVFSEPVMQWCFSNNYVEPTMVQSQTLGVALCGEDSIITASTGSGKTLGYLWPMVAHLHQNAKIKARGVVLVPTRELALQVASVAKGLGKTVRLNSMAITGGNLGRYQLSQELARLKPTIVIATPGRLLDVLSVKKNKEALSLHQVTFVVLDEADKMLQMGFSNQVTELLKNIRPDRQSLMLSATMSHKIEAVAKKWLTNPVRISVGRTGTSSANVDQHLMVLPDFEAKVQFLIKLLPTFVDVGRTIVFCASREGCEKLASRLRGSTQLTLETLHGDKHSTDRNAALKAFAQGETKLLVATDVAGRGLDIPQISTVINFDPAKNWDTHVHRVGRAGRLSSTAGAVQKGTAYTLLTSRDKDFAATLEAAFEREGRPVSADLSALARQSKNRSSGQHNRQGRSKGNRGGHGYYGRPADGDGNNSGGNASGHGSQPPPKRSRWGGR